MAWIKIPPVKWISSDEDAIYAANYFKGKQYMAYDTETTGLNKLKDYPLIFSMSDGVERFGGLADFLQHPAIKGLLESNITKIGSNLNIDRHWSENVGIFLGGDFVDTVTTDWLIDENREGRHGLKDCAYDYCGIIMRDFTDVFPMKRATKNTAAETPKEAILNKISTPAGFEEAKQYAGLDAFANYLVFLKHKEILEKTVIFVDQYGKPARTLWDHYIEFEMPLIKVIYNMERRGIRISTGYLRQMSIVAGKRMIDLETNFHRLMAEKGYDKLFPAPINLNSPMQLRKLFYDIIGKVPFKFTKNTDSPAPSTDSEVIERFAEEGDEFAALLSKYKDVAKTKSAFLEGIQEEICQDGKIHPSFRKVTVSGRFSCTGPNIQQMKRTSEDEFKIRSAFVADDGYLFGSLDFSQLELMILAHVSGDEVMIEAFNTGKDLHLVAVHHIFGFDYEECVAAKKKEKKYGTESLTEKELLIIVLRTAVKRIWYGLNYGIGDEKLALNLTADFRKADKKGKNLQCPSCGSVYPLDYVNSSGRTECVHVGGFPVDDNHTSMSVVRARKMAYKQNNDRDCDTYSLVEIARTVSEKESASYRKKLLGVFKKASQWLENQIKIVNSEKKVQSILGRFRRLNSVDSTNRVDKSRAERQSKNVVQNHAADIVGHVMVLVDTDEELNREGVKLLGQVHDELLIQVPDNENAPKNLARVKHIMEVGFSETVFPLQVNLIADGTLGLSWGDCK